MNKLYGYELPPEFKYEEIENEFIYQKVGALKESFLQSLKSIQKIQMDN